MNFSDLETVLLLAFGILLWAHTRRNKQFEQLLDLAHKEHARANRYADYLILTGKGEGKVVRKPDGAWVFASNVRQESPNE